MDGQQAVFRFPSRKFKGVWWMPWLEKAMKDVAWRRYASGRCLATFDPEMSEWGNPFRYNLMTDAAMRGAYPGK